MPWGGRDAVKVVITGAAGFIGQALVRRVRAEGWETILVTRPEHSGPWSKDEVVPAALEDYKTLGKRIGGCDCLVHLAWAGTRGKLRADRDLQRKNTLYSSQGVESMLQAGCRRIIIAGSQAEYGLQQGQVTEETECKPDTAYGKAKFQFFQEASELCAQYGASCIELRVFSLFGPGDAEDTLISSTLRNMRKNAPCRFTQGTQRWDYLYISDAAEAFFRSCTESCPNGCYNIASGTSRPLREYIEQMADITETNSPLLFGAFSSASPPPGLWADISWARRRMGWAPKVSFEAGIRAILRAWDQEKPDMA